MPENEPKFDTIKPVKPRPAFAGFVPRAAAFILDGAVLYMLAWAFDRAARPALLSLNPALPWLGHVVAFLYFLILDGPLGKGRTTGKLTIGLHTVTADGGAPDWSAAARRALVKQAVFFAAMINPLTGGNNVAEYSQILPAGMMFEAVLVLNSLWIVSVMFLFALAIAVSMHPYRRGWHDVWAGTFVSYDPTPNTFHEALAEPLEPAVRQRMVFNTRMLAVLFLIGSVAILIRPVASLLKPESKEPFENTSMLNRDSRLPGLRINAVMFPNAEYKNLLAKQIESARAAAAKYGKTVMTTETLRQSQLYDGESISVVALKVRGALPWRDAASSDMLKAADDVRATAWRHWQQADPKGEKLPARQFKMLLIEPLKFLVYNHTKWQAVIEGPADPTAGPLTVSDPNIRPATTDETTTSTSTQPAGAPAPQPANGPGTP